MFYFFYTQHNHLWVLFFTVLFFASIPWGLLYMRMGSLEFCVLFFLSITQCCFMLKKQATFKHRLVICNVLPSTEINLLLVCWLVVKQLAFRNWNAFIKYNEVIAQIYFRWHSNVVTDWFVWSICYNECFRSLDEFTVEPTSVLRPVPANCPTEDSAAATTNRKGAKGTVTITTPSGLT